MKKDALSKDTYRQIREAPVSQQGRLFSEALELPENLMAQERNHMAVLLMINSHRVVFKKQLIPAIQSMMQPYIQELWPQYFEIFSDNSCNQRVIFFQDELIHHLWNKFRREYAVHFQDYLDNKVGDSTNSLDDKKERFLQDID